MYSLTLGYAGDGAVTSANDSANQNWTYAYDAFNRLSQATNTSTSPNQIYQYLYDRFGNRWQQNYTQGGPPGYQMQLSFSGNNQMSSPGYRYDAAGDVVMDNLNCYSYDAESRLSSVAPISPPLSGLCGADTMTYLYDAEGRRVARLQNGALWKQYYYDAAGHMITEANASGTTLRAEIYAGDRHLATWAINATYFNHADWLGTERARTFGSGSQAGQVCETITSLPFGDGENTTGSCSNPEPSPNHFTGLEHDTESGLDHTLNRQYASSYARWLSPDPAGEKVVRPDDPQTWNMYEYAHNNPMTLTDPSGLGTLDDILDAASEVAHFAAGAANAWASDNLLGGFRVDQQTASGEVGAAVGDAVATAQGVVETALGAGGEVAGVALDATGIGALVGVPANVVSAGVMAHGTVTAGEGYMHLAKSATSGETEAAAAGREAHRDFADKVKQKPGWQSEPKMTDPATGKKVKPDAVTKSGRPLEYKPNSPSGERAGARQLRKYQRAARKRGRVIYYDQ